MVMQHDDAVGPGRRLAQAGFRVRELARPDSPGLVAPRTYRIEADDVERGGRIGGLGRLPLVLECAERACEASRKGIGDVVIARNRQDGAAETAEESSRIAELACAAAVAEIPARDHQFGLEPVDQDRRPPFDRRIVTRSEMEVGQV
jgi:hypothetical protein